jgi:hypothetical protein
MTVETLAGGRPAYSQQVDLTQDSLQGTGATDWTTFPQRMHFIADLFRARQTNIRLFEALPDVVSLEN